MSSHAENRKEIYLSWLNYFLNKDRIDGTTDYDNFVRIYPNLGKWVELNFSDFSAVTKQWNACKKKLSSTPHNRSNFDDFLKNYACDLEPFTTHRICSGEPEPTPPQNTETPDAGETPETPSPDTGETPETTTPPPTSTTPYSPPPSDKSKDSPNELPDPEGNGTEYNIPGDPYQWRVGKDGGWWAKRSDQSVWYNISGRAQKDMPNWGVSIKRMDDYSFEGNAEKRAKSGTSEPVAESFISLKLGKFFLD